MNLNLERLPAYIARRADGELVIDSRNIAEAYGKRHTNVTREINKRRADSDPTIIEFSSLNFEQSTYVDQGGKVRTCFKVTRDGFAELAMSFSGRQAMLLRIALLQAFHVRGDRIETLTKSLLEQRHGVEREESASKQKGYIGSRLMNERKREKPLFNERFMVLDQLMQPSLFPALETS